MHIDQFIQIWINYADLLLAMTKQICSSSGYQINALSWSFTTYKKHVIVIILINSSKAIFRTL